MADHLKMGRIAAQAVVALVIDLFLCRDIPIEMGVDDTVNSRCFPIDGDTAIATASTVARIATSPDVAGAGLIVQDEA
jgi:hypothetical protein